MAATGKLVVSYAIAFDGFHDDTIRVAVLCVTPRLRSACNL